MVCRMGAKVRFFAVALLLGLPAHPAGASDEAAAAGFRGAVPAGWASVALSCSHRSVEAEGILVAAFAVTADRTGLPESSVFATVSWDHGRVETRVATQGTNVTLRPVDVALYGSEHRLTLRSQWGGEHRTWAATAWGGCASAGGSMADASMVVSGAPAASHPANAVVATPADFAGTAVQSEAAAFGLGALHVDGGSFLLGMFRATSGRISAEAPLRAAAVAEGYRPTLFLQDGPGAWRFELDGIAAWDPPYALAAIRFA